MFTAMQTVFDTSLLPPLIRTDTAAALLEVTPRKVRNMCARGEIKAVKIGTDWRINTSALLEQYGVSQ